MLGFCWTAAGVGVGAVFDVSVGFEQFSSYTFYCEDFALYFVM